VIRYVLFARLLTVFLLIDLADTPLTCADDSSGSPFGAVGAQVLSQNATSLLTRAVRTPDSGNTHSCGCLCQHAYDFADPVISAPFLDPAGSVAGPGPRGNPPPSRSFDHPPQNLS
jgi:hypothetical protein